MSLIALLHGMLFMASIILSLGPQNLHVIRCGIQGERVLGVVLVCVLGDSLLILLGTLCVAQVADAFPSLNSVLRSLGFLVLSYYAIAILICQRTDESERQNQVFTPIAGAIAFTVLNPCVYLDSFFLVGQQANLYAQVPRWYFAFGATVWAMLWYFALGFGVAKVKSGRLLKVPPQFLDYAMATVLLVAAVYCLM